MKALAIAAIAFAGLTLPSPPASADASNCTVWNGPFCETAHNIRHHGWQLPIVWEQPRLPHWPQPWLGGPVGPDWGGAYPYPQPYPQPYPVTTGCAIPSVWSCRHRVPFHGGFGY